MGLVVVKEGGVDNTLTNDGQTLVILYSLINDVKCLKLGQEANGSR